MVIVGARLVKWHQVPSYYDTVLCNNSRLLHSTVKKKKKKKKKKKWQTRHQVPRCWPHSTVCRSPGHGIWSTWANGDIPMYIWADNRNTGRFLEPPFRSQEPFPLPETEVTSSKMAGGSGNGSWLLNGGSKNLPILLLPISPPVKKVCCYVKIGAILKMPKYYMQLQFDIRYEKIVPNYARKSIFVVMTSSMTS